MSEEKSYSDLKELDWFKIPGSDYLIKYNFFDEGYSILVTNLKVIFGEIVSEMEVQRRFSGLNVHAKMKTSIILRNLKEALDSVLVEGNEYILGIYCSDEFLAIKIQFIVNRATLSFSFKPFLLSPNQLRSHVLVPILSHALLTHQENIVLKKKNGQLESKLKCEQVSKDSMLDYKKNQNAFHLITNSNVSEAVILDSFLNVSKDMQACLNDRKKVVELQQNRVPSSIPDQLRTPIKRETSSSSLPIEYDEDKEENGEQSIKRCLQLPVKREISETNPQSLKEEENASQNGNQAPPNFEKAKKKKSFKF